VRETDDVGFSNRRHFEFTMRSKKKHVLLVLIVVRIACFVTFVFQCQSTWYSYQYTTGTTTRSVIVRLQLTFSHWEMVDDRMLCRPFIWFLIAVVLFSERVFHARRLLIRRNICIKRSLNQAAKNAGAT
jgi:hypothetical protein